MIRLKVSPLGPQMTKERLKDVFEEYGKVDSVKILRGVGDNAPAMGFVFMPREAAAQEAINELNGQEIDGIKLQIETSFEHITVHRDPAKPKPIVVDDDDEEEEEEEEETASSEVAEDYEESEEPDWEV